VITVDPLRGGRALVRFRVDSDHPGCPVGVAGEFNDWDWQATPFRLVGDELVASVSLPAGAHRFRYRSSDGGWFNDAEAPDYVENEFGGADCVVYVAESPPRP
jgi:hypothetical protein